MAGYLLALALLWTLLPWCLQSVPHADNVEQLDWAHAWSWGYVKHPPLPTWLLHVFVAFLGESALLTYALAMACAVLALALLWACARQVLDRGGALCALLLASANYYVMGRGSYLNHNTVMLPFVAASAWAVLRIVRPGAPASAAPWLLLGLAQAGGMLTKYQMAVVIAANCAALLAAQVWRQPRFAAHAALAVLATIVPLLPHLAWLAAHEFSTFSYAGHSLLRDLGALERLRQALSFGVQQVGRFAPALVAAALAWALARRLPAAPAATPVPAQQRRTLALLACTPVLLVFALTLFAGVAPQNHWGATTTFLLPLWAVAAAPALRRAAPAGLPLAVVLVQILAAAWSVVDARVHPQFHHQFPATALAGQAQAYWQAHASGRLAVIAGPDWEVGALSLALADHPDVLASGDPRQAPWVDDARLHRCGALVFWRPDAPPETQVGASLAAALREPLALQAAQPHGGAARLMVGVVPPQGPGC